MISYTKNNRNTLNTNRIDIISNTDNILYTYNTPIDIIVNLIHLKYTIQLYTLHI